MTLYAVALGAASAAATITTAPGRPTDLAAAAGDGEVALSWTALSGALTAHEYRYRAAGGSWGAWTAISDSAAISAHTVTGLTNGTEYEFQVRARSGSADSQAGSQSNTATATPMAAATAGVTTVATDTTATEGSTTATATFTVALNTVPSSNVTVTVTAPAGLTLDGPDAGATFASSEAIPFTTSNWSTAQTVTVRATDDSTDSPIGRELTVTYAAASSDTDYSGLTGDAAAVTVVDNDPTAVTLAGSAGDVVEGGTKDFTITLNRGLVNGEALPVPLTFGGGATRGTDYTTACPTSLPTGVTCNNLNTATTPTVTFTGPSTGTTATQVTLTLSATTDSTAEPGGETVAIGLGTLNASSGTGLGGGASGADNLADFRITDNAAPALVLDPASLMVAEGGSATYTVALATQPTGNVTVTVSGASGEVTFDTDSASPGDQSTLAFTTTTWNAAQTVTVSAGEDNDTSNDSATLTHSASGGGYGSATGNVAVTVTDDDAPAAARPAQPTGLTATAGDMQVVLSWNAPASNAITKWQYQLLESTRWREIPASNAMTRRHTVTGLGNGLTYNIRVRAVAGAVNGQPSAPVSVRPLFGVAVLSPTSLTVAEGGDATYTVRLSAQPRGGPNTHVLVGISSNNSDVTVSPAAELDFTIGNWQTPQTVTVSAKHDPDAVHDRATLSHSVQGGGYTLGSGPDLNLVVNDDESGTPPPPAVQTNAAPTVATPIPDQNARVGAPFSHTFPANTFNDADGDPLTYSATGLPAWLGFDPATRTFAGTPTAVGTPAVTVTASDGNGGSASDTFAIAISAANAAPVLTISGGSTVTEGAAASFTVRADSAPTSNLTVSRTVADAPGADFLAAGVEGSGTWTFPGGQTSQTFTIATEADSVAERSGPIRVTLAAGTGYTLGGASTAAVTVNDDDDGPPSGGGGGGGTPSLPRSAASVSAGPAVVEGGEATFRITASPAPSGEITVRVRVSATGDFVEAALLGERSVTLSASAPTASLRIATIDDRRNEADGTVTVTLLSGEDYRLSQASAASLAVTDDDTPALVLTPETLTVDEGGSATWTVALATEPAADVTVTVASTNGEVTTARNTLTFTASNWNMAQSVVVSAAQDADAADDRARLDHRASGGGYGSVTGSVAVTVMDDDTPGLVLTPAALTVAEGASATWTVALATEPTGNVTVTVAGTSEVTVDRSTLSFTARNWNTAQSVTLFAAPDDDMVNDLATVAHRARGGDYSSVTGSVAVTVTDAGAAVVSAHLARFGRTVAEQALEGIADRLTAPRTPGMEGAFAGRALSFALAGDGQAVPGPTGSAQGSGDADGLGFTPRGFGDDADHFGESYEAPQTTTMRQALLGSHFTLTGAPDDAGGSAAFWGRAAEGRFEGREDTLSLEGTVTTALLGADYARDDWLFGLALTQSASEGSHAGGARAGDLDASLSAVLPYASVHVTPRLKLWGAAGLGAGEVTLKTQEAHYRADTEWTMAAAGLRSTLLTPPPEGAGPALALTADALWTRTASERARDLAASDSDVTRLRLGLEGRYSLALDGTGQLTPRLEAGMRHDGGDAETGLGLELGGGLAWSAPTLGLTLDVSGRTLIAHDDDDLKDRGLAAAFTFDPRPESARGPSLTLRQDVGDRAEGGLDALFAPDPLADRTGSAATARWTLEGAWGFSALGGRFTASPHLELGLAPDTRETTLGWRLTPAAPAAPDLTFDVKAIRREDDLEAPAHTVGVEATVRW